MVYWTDVSLVPWKISRIQTYALFSMCARWLNARGNFGSKGDNFRSENEQNANKHEK